MMPSRPLPAPRAAVRIWHFGGEAEAGAIVEVREGGRCLLVAGVGGTTREFTLRRATAVFVARGERETPYLEVL
jgi:hypothetical protein